MSEFAGFSDSGLELLAALPSYTRDEFKAVRPRYEEQLLEPAKDFVVAVGDLLHARISPQLAAEARSSPR